MKKPTENTSNGRRQFLAGSAALATGAALSMNTRAAASRSKLSESVKLEDTNYVISPPSITSMEIDGTADRFPLRRVFCLGRNYRAHAIESGDNPDETPPFFFIKPRDAVIPSAAGFPYPLMTEACRYEVEMVVALKSGGVNIAADDALDHVFGYGVGLDMTRQDLQENAQELSRPWAISKSFDKSAPCGPLYSVEKNGHAVTGRIWLSVNGAVKQDSDLKLQRWSVGEGIAVLSQYYELAAGDIILTGTPAGIGLVQKGDVIKAGIDGLGKIEVDVI